MAKPRKEWAKKKMIRQGKATGGGWETGPHFLSAPSYPHSNKKVLTFLKYDYKVSFMYHPPPLGDGFIVARGKAYGESCPYFFSESLS